MRSGLQAIGWVGALLVLVWVPRPALCEEVKPPPASAGQPATAQDREAKLKEAAELLKQAEQAEKEGKYAQGVELAERSLKLREEVLGPDHPDVAQSLNRLAVLYWRQGEYKKAEPLHLRALGIREKALGPTHPDVAQSLNGLAILYKAQGEYKKAEPLYLRALGIREKALGPTHPDVAKSLNGLAILYCEQGEYKKAEPPFVRALGIREKALGPTHPEVGEALNNLANLYWEQGEYKKAEPLYLRALGIREKALGPAHPDVAQSLDNLANLYSDQGEYKKAEPLYLRALGIREKALGPTHPDVAQSLNNLAILYKDQGEYKKAEPLHLRALQIKEKALGPAHPDVASSLNNLAVLYWEQGEYKKAEPLHLRALQIKEKALGPTHPDVALSLNNLGELYRAQGEYRKAEPLCLRALQIKEKALGPTHPAVADSLNTLAHLYLARDQAREAIPLAYRSFVARELFLRAESTVLSEGRWDKLYKLQQEDHEARYSLARVLPAESQVKRLLLTMTLLHKGRSLEEVTQMTQAMRQGLTSPEQVALFEQWIALRSQVANLSWNPPPGPGFRERLQLLTDQAALLEEGLAKSSERFRSLRLPPPDQMIAEVARRLPDKGVLVEYVSYRPYRFSARGLEPRWEDRRYLAVLLSPDQHIDLVDLGPAAAIHTAVDRLRDRLTSVMDAAAAGQALYKLVMAPLLPHLGGHTRLLISPDDRLNLVPFSALHDGQAYLLDRYSFTYLTTGRSLLLPQEQVRGPRTLVVFADPDFAARPPGMPAPAPAGTPAPAPAAEGAVLASAADRGLSRGLADLAPLPGTRREAMALKERFPSAQLYLGPTATESTLLHQRAPTLLHIATHGVFVEEGNMDRQRAANQRIAIVVEDTRTRLVSDNPLTRSALVLAGAKATGVGGSADDGLATALEVAGMDLHGTQLVVLSACDTGRGDVRPIQGVYGLRRAFLIAGAETLVTSLWRVSDDATKELMVSYYDNLLKGQGRVQTMETAARAMRSKHPEPYYWAPFIVIGRADPLR